MGYQNVVNVGATANSSTFSTSNTLYVIAQNVSLTGSAVVGANCCLDFRGGAIVGGAIEGSKTEIRATHVTIFDNCLVSGDFSNEEIYANWFGTYCDGSNDDSVAINKALALAQNATVVLDNREYLVMHTLLINNYNTRLRCAGTLISDCVNEDDDSNVLLKFTTGYSDIDIYRMRRKNTTIGNLISYRGTAIEITGYCEFSRFRIGTIEGFKKGISLVPRPITSSSGGIQYCKFDFMHINCRYGIYFDLVDSDNGFGLWVNENQFTGGRLEGEYGIYVKKPQGGEANWDRINGNVFNSIGFEGLVNPISLCHAAFCKFNDLRMSESISGIYFDLSDCRFMDFSVKSMVPYKKIVSNNCVQVRISATFVDNGYGYGSRFNRLVIDHANNDDVRLLGRENDQMNITKQLYFDNNNPPTAGMNFDDLLVTTFDNEKILSSNCGLMSYYPGNIPISLDGSVAKLLGVDVTLNCVLGNACSFSLTQSGSNDLVINHTGVYRLVFNRDNEPRLFEM